MFEVFGQDFFGEGIFVDDYEPDSIWSPLDDVSILLILSHLLLTFNSS
jgi:hypothetical protein